MKALGLRVKSGFAIAIVASGDEQGWTILSRHQVPLTDGTDAYARFPLHPGLELEASAAQVASSAAVAAIKAAAQREIAGLVKSLQPIATAVLVVGSVIDPEKISNPHIRAHAGEGRLYREVIGSELDRHGIAHQVLVERDAYAFVALRLKRTEAQLRAEVDRHGKGVVKPWRADEKLAALAACWPLTGGGSP
jgi:hypothetical protein